MRHLPIPRCFDEIVDTRRDEAPADPAPEWDDLESPSAEREARFFAAVDRAIAEMAGRRRRRLRRA